jgi:capsular polysaccharide export protein
MTQSPTDTRVRLLPDGCRLTDALDQCDRVYVVSSQVGFEAILRGKRTEVFGLPFYAGWGLTNDRQTLPRRQRRITVEELFHAACIKHSVYVNPETGSLIEIEDALDMITALKERVKQMPLR